MSGFSADWLALREPFDLAARSRQVEEAFMAALPVNAPLRILDLASGAGSTVAALSGRLRERQTWLLTDHDPQLLHVAKARYSDQTAMTIEFEVLDLARELDSLPFQEVDGITTSAFLDLVTEQFLRQLVETIVFSGKPFLASLSYDGRAACEPADPLDETIRQAMNAHQQTDKGFGAALGPQAWSVAAALFREAGYDVVTGSSDWFAGQGDAAFQAALLEGWIEASAETGVAVDQLQRWKERRFSEIQEESLSVLVGHQDLAAVPRLR
jgi:hypothetical protein